MECRLRIQVITSQIATIWLEDCGLTVDTRRKKVRSNGQSGHRLEDQLEPDSLAPESG